MDWNSYKQLCDRPHVFSRWMLEQTVELIREDLDVQARRLAQVLEGQPLVKPADHKGDGATDMFELDLEPGWVRDIRGAMTSAVRRGANTLATRERGLGGFVEAWTEYVGDQENAAARTGR